jgi:HD-GYP domain-containing protein (c-di-GMP phosphodiesterase class II)
MTDTRHDYVLPEQLRVGLFVELELGWMAHPFPKGSFKISSERQIETLRGLGVPRIRVVPARSDPPPAAASALEPLPAPSPADAEPEEATPEQDRRAHRRALLEAQRQSLAHCDAQFGAALRGYTTVLETLRSDPAQAAGACRALVEGIVADVLQQGESSIRLLSETQGDRACMHPVNVTVLSLLLGKALGLDTQALQDLGTAAFLHDIGKIELPERVRWMDSQLSAADYRVYQDHVAHGLLLGRSLALSDGALAALAEHHEAMDASGFPRQLAGAAISLPGKILALVNRYDNMCNPARPATAVTPHEALSLIFSQMKQRYDGVVLAAFIRMMGVYPPGSVVQLSDAHYALVVSVNSARPLKPRVLVHDPAVPSTEALILDLERADAPGIRRSLKPASLPRAVFDYLSPRARICYFFERAMALDRVEVPA